MSNLEYAESDNNEHVTVRAYAADLDRKVEVRVWIHSTGTVVVDIDSNSKSSIDVDVNDSTVVTVRDGDLAHLGA
ncbi:hypothetical protein GS454_04755 [Rhodococcus hoagii]|nr:hypothetical protein [Prescottella equi]